MALVDGLFGKMDLPYLYLPEWHKLSASPIDSQPAKDAQT